MEETKSLEGVYLLLGLVLWLIIFIVIRWSVNKNFVSENGFNPRQIISPQTFLMNYKYFIT